MKRTNSSCIFLLGMLCLAVIAGIVIYYGYEKTDDSQQKQTADKPAVIIENENPPQENNGLTQETDVIQNQTKYLIVAEEGYLTVYHSDRKSVYAFTDISYANLSEELQMQIDQGMAFSSEEKLYDFLENYSS